MILGVGMLALSAACGEESATEEVASRPARSEPTTVTLPVSTTTSSIPPVTTSSPLPAPTAVSPTPPSQPIATQPPAAAGNITVPNMVGEDLQLAQDTMQAAGLYSLKSHDVTGQDRFQVVDRNWKVCDQSPPPGARVAPGTLVDFGVVRDEEACP